MNLKSITSRGSQKGFTIVELLIVIVIIGILAAIVIVAYNGLTDRAKSAGAESTGSTLQKKFEAYYADTGTYPATYSALTGSSDSGEVWYIAPGTYTVKNGNLANTDSEKHFELFSCATGNGRRIETRNYAENNDFVFIVGTCTGTPTRISS